MMVCGLGGAIETSTFFFRGAVAGFTTAGSVCIDTSVEQPTVRGATPLPHDVLGRRSGAATVAGPDITCGDTGQPGTAGRFHCTFIGRE